MTLCVLKSHLYAPKLNTVKNPFKTNQLRSKNRRIPTFESLRPLDEGSGNRPKSLINKS
jgi:hypothetical protein